MQDLATSFFKVETGLLQEIVSKIVTSKTEYHYSLRKILQYLLFVQGTMVVRVFNF